MSLFPRYSNVISWSLVWIGVGSVVFLLAGLIAAVAGPHFPQP